MSWSPFRDAKTRARWRHFLMWKQNGLCGLCGHRLPQAADALVHAGLEPTFDHIVPRARGGDDALTNLRLVHHCCNELRAGGDGLQRTPPIPRSLQ